MRSIGPDGGLNLLQDLKPPKSLYIEVNFRFDFFLRKLNVYLSRLFYIAGSQFSRYW